MCVHKTEQEIGTFHQDARDTLSAEVKEWKEIQKKMARTIAGMASTPHQNEVTQQISNKLWNPQNRCYRTFPTITSHKSIFVIHPVEK